MYLGNDEYVGQYQVTHGGDIVKTGMQGPDIIL